MQPNPLLGVVFHWLGGLSSGTFYVPYKGVRKWSWETFWLAGGMFSLCCTMNGMMMCQCNLCLCKCDCTMTKDGVCFTCTSGDKACCDMIQACCDCVCACVKAGCVCCVCFNGMPCCCGCCC